MGRKCSQCGNTGHNSRTCTAVKGCNNPSVVGGLRLFGVQLDISSSPCSSPTSSSTNSSVAMKKSLSLDCLSSSPSSPLSFLLVSVHENRKIKTSINGYLSDGLIGKAQEKRKGVPWTEQEHRKFLVGLEKLGKGDWRGISRNFVTTRTPTQVASHAQKYFLRQTSINHKKRRSSLFDMVGSYNKANHKDDQENGHSLIDLNSFGDDQEMMMMTTIKDDDQECKTSSNHLSISLWSHASPNSSHLISSKSSNAKALDLELALGAPKHVDKTKPSSNSPLLGPISVT